MTLLIQGFQHAQFNVVGLRLPACKHLQTVVVYWVMNRSTSALLHARARKLQRMYVRGHCLLLYLTIAGGHILGEHWCNAVGTAVVQEVH